MNHDRKIDITGLCCAAPIIKISKELENMQSEDVLLALFAGGPAMDYLT